ncbi:MAG: hypothetical protein ABSF96_05485 [Steroidobacteraceae bacterium]|jgi:hypothetical protein
MTNAYPGLHASRPTSGTADDDDRDDEHQVENEAPVREVEETTEAPEEFDEPSGNHGEGDPQAAARFNKAETRFVESARGTKAIREGADVQPQEESELQEAERLGKARAKK